MIPYQRNFLSNGLEVLVHHDPASVLCSVNLLYKVGSRDENYELTGLAHLVEHLMFAGDFDQHVQRASGEANAFTSPDLTDYYLTLPAPNLETAFWLESGRMAAPRLAEALEIQRKVVIEEFNQRYLNQPYGDTWMKLRELAYTIHPYRWATIGRTISHIESITLADVQSFFERFYSPANAILSVAGPMPAQQVFELAQKWFGDIESKSPNPMIYPAEPEQLQPRTLEVPADVPQKAIYMAFHGCKANSDEIFPTMLMLYILGQGRLSRLYNQLVKIRQKFVQAGVSTTASLDTSLITVSGRLAPGVDFQQGQELIWEQLLNWEIEEQELQKAKNQLLTELAFGELGIWERSYKLALASLSGMLEDLGQEAQRIQAVSVEEIVDLAKRTFAPSRANIMLYGK